MHPIIEAHKSQLFALCRKYQVQKLYAFGSVVDGSFDEKASDIDLLYVMQIRNPLDMGDAILDLYMDLQVLFARKVDLVSENAMKNKYFIEAVNKSKKIIYET